MAETFNSAKKRHDELVTTPGKIDREALLGSLDRLAKLGAEEVKDESIGHIVYANEMTRRLTGALALNDQNRVEPPFLREQTQVLEGQIEGFSLITTANGENQGVMDAPTPTEGLQTSAQK